MLGSTILIFLAEALALPTGILIAALLTRHLGAEGYGLFALAMTLVIWIEWVIASLFAGATVKLVREAQDWRPVGSAALRLSAVAGGAAMLMLWLLASPIAALLNEPALISLVSIFALDIPVFCLTHAHRNILIGMGSFNKRAFASMVRSLSKLLLITLAIKLGLSIQGAILGCIGASLTELIVIRKHVNPSLLGRCDFPLHRFRGYATPMFLSTLSLGILDRLDLFMLKWLGGTAELAGIYSAAQTLAIAPCILSTALAPLLLSSQTRLLYTGQEREAREIGRETMRAIVGLLPIAAIAAGAAPEVVAWIYGKNFLPAAPLFGLLIVAESALVMVTVAMASLIAAGKPKWTFTLNGPLVLLAFAGHLGAIPWLGALGASLVTAVVTTLGALAAVAAVNRCLRVLPPAGTVARSVTLSALAYLAALSWPAAGFFLLLKLSVIGLSVLFLFFVLGEFSAKDIERVRELLHWGPTGEKISRGV